MEFKNILPENEKERIQNLYSYNILDTLPEEDYDTITKLIAIICEVPIALISIIDHDRQWFKSKYGLDVNETPRNISFCQHAILQEELFEVTDASKDDRFKENPLVKDGLKIRFYGAFPLIGDNDLALGTLCVIDDKPKKLSDQQIEALRTLSKQVVRNFKLSKELAEKRSFQKFFDSSVDLLCIAKTDGYFERLNPSFSRVLGYSEEELLNAPFFDFIHPEDREKTAHEIQKLREGIPTVEFINRFLKKNGEHIVLNWSCGPDPETGKLFAIAHDITAIKNQEIELRNAKKQAEQNLLAKENFLANMSHEIRTPMNAIMGFTEILRSQNLSEENLDYLNAINTAGENLLVIINDILDLSKIESGNLKLDRTTFSFKNLITNSKRLLKDKAAEKNIGFNFYIENDIPENLISDPNRLNQILINLIGNAIKFTDKGKVEVFANLINKKNDIATIEVVVKDSGIGIPDDKKHLIFQRFQQADDNNNRKYGGTGLGLNISKKLTELLGGEISFTSQHGMGSEFKFVIPFEIGNKNVTNVSREETSEKTVDLSGFNILLVEDNILNQKLALKVLGDFKANTHCEENGQLAIEYLKENKPDIILMDLQMPVMDGYIATKFIRDALKIKTPIIAMTAHSLVGDKEKCMAVGMNDYISKPFKKEELLKKIIEHKNSVVSSPIVKTVERPVYSLNNLNSLANGDEDFIQNICKIFVESQEEDLKLLSDFVRNEKLIEVNKMAHKMKSSYGMFQADDLVELCQLLEHEKLFVNAKLTYKALKSQAKILIDEINLLIK